MDINEIGATAFVVSSCIRAMEEKQEHKLFDDPCAAWFVNEAIEEKVQELIRVFPPSLELVRYRVCVMSEVVERGIAAGVKQIVSLGAGFDMRAHIYQTEGVRFCDVDQPAVLQFKNKVLEARRRHALPRNRVQLPGSRPAPGTRRRGLRPGSPHPVHMGRKHHVSADRADP